MTCRLTKTWKRTALGSFAGFKREEVPENFNLLTMHQEDGKAPLRCVSENNWLRRFLYWIGAPRRFTRSV